MKAIITGITGQDGSHLADLLLEKNYEVIGVTRRTSGDNVERIKHILNHPNLKLVEAMLPICLVFYAFFPITPM